MSKIKNVPAWAWRKTLYFVGAAVVAGLGAFGILNEVQVNEWTDQLDKILPYVIGVFIPLLAGSHTHAGSDSTATDEDLVRAYPPADVPVAKVVTKVEDAVRDAVARIPGADQVASAVLAAIRAEERGEPDTVTETATETAAATTDYVYGRQ